MNVLGNLDCEARWAGVGLPQAVAQRISLYAALAAALVDEPCTVFAPAAVDPARLLAVPGWVPPVMRVGAANHDLAWADPEARDANDRARALAIATELGAALPGAQVVASLAALDAAVPPGPWVAKARWTSAGRDRAHGSGPPAGELRTRLGRMFERFGALVLEPWLERIVDLGICGVIEPGGIRLEAPHTLLSDARGGFTGIDLAVPALTATERARFEQAAHAAAAQLAPIYRGPFAIDGFVYTADGQRHLHPLCEINARHSFGWVARALGRRLGTTRLGFSPPPAAAHVLIAPGADRVTAWCA